MRLEILNFLFTSFYNSSIHTSYWQWPQHSEFAIVNITDIMWNSLSFKSLMISQHNKEILLMLIQSHIVSFKESSFNDFVKRKEKNLIIFLQYVFQCSHYESKHNLSSLVINLRLERQWLQRKLLNFRKDLFIMFVNSAESMHYSFYFEQICIRDLKMNT